MMNCHLLPVLLCIRSESRVQGKNLAAFMLASASVVHLPHTRCSQQAGHGFMANFGYARHGTRWGEMGILAHGSWTPRPWRSDEEEL
jgi:hypothetical protein